MRRNKLRVWELALMAALVITVIFGSLIREQESLSGKLVRLHVIANSDLDGDQALKLKVRDRVLSEAERILDGCTDASEAEKALSGSLGQIEAAAQETVASAGGGDRVTATLSKEYYPTREYDTFSLPAGNYTSLRVKIGEAGGRNWWCVVFPPLCASAAGSEVYAEAGLTKEEVKLITGDGGGYVVKFKMVELAEKLLELLKK